MKRLRIISAGLVIGLCGPPSTLAVVNAPDATEVGLARVDVTPSSPVRLGGYLSRSKESEGVSLRIWAKAISISGDGRKPAVIVAVDNLGVGRQVVEDVADRLRKRTGLERSRFVVASTHTHSAPCLTGVAPNIFGKPIDADEQGRIDAYTKDLADKIERVSLEALAARKPARLSWTQGTAAFASNRRTKGGPVDYALPVIRVTDVEGKLVGVLLNYACHCTTLDPNANKVDGDWAGYAQAAIESDHPGALALTAIGCGADANPVGRLASGAAASHGRTIADELNRLLKSPWIELDGITHAAYESLSLPYDKLPTRSELEELVHQGGPKGYNASVHLAALDRDGSLPAALDYSCQLWAFGDKLAMVFLPGEVVVDYVLRLKNELDPKRLWVTAYANDVPCYIPSERILKEGGYEGGGAMVYYARPAPLKTGVERIIIDGVHKIIPDVFRPKPKAGETSTAPKPIAPSPEAALRAIRVGPGLRVELVASEPLIQSPVAIDFGTDGKLWVCEMRDYPTGLDGNWKPGGVVKFMEDKDGDGRYDTATEFLTGLPFPTGVTAWRKGVIICAAPNIIYAEDSDGDGKADVRRVLFQGFATENYQARVNGLSYNIDDWVYGANGLIGGSIKGTATGKVIDIGGRDFRIRPDSGVMEPVSGLTQQGRVHDDWGNQFGGNNSVWFQHYPLADRDSARNPHVAAPDPTVNISREEDWTRLFPASRTVARFNHPESANRVTSACSPLIYRDDVLGKEFANNAFVCEPVHNLIHREILTPDGVTFAGRRAPDEKESEFLASTDHWFRPVQVRTGPDGAIWVVDMSRFVIEHPRWISPELLTTLDVRAGAETGRIYRVVPEIRRLRPKALLDTVNSASLAKTIDMRNGTLRDDVQRLLVHRGATDAAAVLRGVVKDGVHPEGRVQAFATLDALKSLDPETLRTGMFDLDPRVRRAAVRAARAYVSSDEAVGRSVLALADDPDPGVRFDVALGLGDWSDFQAGQALARIAVRDAGDPWVRAAVISSAARHPTALLDRVAAELFSNGEKSPAAALLEPVLRTIVGMSDKTMLRRALVGVAGRGNPAHVAAWRIGAVATLLESSDDDTLAAEPAVAVVAQAARVFAADPTRPPENRATASRMLGRVRAEATADRETLTSLLEPDQPPVVQSAAVKALARASDPGAVAAVLEHWSAFGPTVRSSTLDRLTERPITTEALLASLESKAIAPQSIDAAHRQTLLTAGPEPFRQRAAAVFRAQAIGPRARILEAYAAAKSTAGDPSRGRETFVRVCAACHRVSGVGHDVGPDLAALTDTSPEALVTAILDPNREVDARYVGYSAALKDGRGLSGLLTAETATGLTLRRQEGQSEVVLRSELEALKSTGLSFMPEGLENDLKPGDVVDLLAFLARSVRRPKQLAGNRPGMVASGTDGVVRLSATTAEAYGPTLTFEGEFGNLGHWSSPQDFAVWTFKTDQDATYTVSMEWACSEESAGNGFSVKVGPSLLRTIVGPTGARTWSNYRTIFLLETTLPAGVHRLEFRPTGDVRGSLLDLRAVVLTPRSARVFRARP